MARNFSPLKAQKTAQKTATKTSRYFFQGGTNVMNNEGVGSINSQVRDEEFDLTISALD